MERLEARRERLINAAIAANKIPESRRDHYRQAWNKDPGVTEALLAELAPGLTPSGEVPASVRRTRRVGPLPPAAEEVAAEGIPTEWFGGRRDAPPSAEPASDVEADGLPWVARSKAPDHGRVTFARDE
jgi:hypothetical protein